MKKKWKLLIGALVLIGLVLATVIQLSRPLAADLLTVAKSDIAKTFQEEGTVRARNEALVYTVYGGRIIDIPVREGDRVQAGDLLAQFDSQDLAYQLKQLQSQRRSIEAQKDLQELTLDLEAMKLLYEAGAISKKEYDEASHTVNSDYYPALIAAVDAQIAQLNYQISQRNAYAPADGTVANLAVKKGMVLAPGMPLMSVFTGNEVNVEVYVLTEDASRLQTGNSVKLIQKNKTGDILFEGTIDQIAPSAEEKISTLGLVEQRVKVTIIPRIPAGLELKPGYALRAEFTLDRQENQLVVPKTALFPHADGDALWVVQKGKAVIRAVEKGMENDREVAITQGLEEGEQIILNPKLEGLSEGKKISVISK